MKKIILITALVLVAMSLSAQVINYTELAKFNINKDNGFTSYVSSNNTTFRVNDRLTLKDQTSSRLKYIYLYEEYSISDVVMSMSTKYLTINRITVIHTPSNRFAVLFNCSDPQGLSTYVISVEQAILAKEII